MRPKPNNAASARRQPAPGPLARRPGRRRNRPSYVQVGLIFGCVEAAEPPMRDIEDWPVHIRCREVPSLHELTGAGSNAEEDKKSRLPAPKNYSLDEA